MDDDMMSHQQTMLRQQKILFFHHLCYALLSKLIYFHVNDMTFYYFGQMFTVHPQTKSATLEHIVTMPTHQHSPLLKNKILLFRLYRGQAEASVSVSLPAAPWSSRHLGVYYATPGLLWAPLSELPH